MKRVIISDIHIGSKYYKADELASFLKDIEYDELILAGDIIDFIKVPLFTKRAKRIVDAIDFSKRVIYLVGNHDASMEGFIGESLFGIEFKDKYEFFEGGRKFRVQHGHQYDHVGLINYHAPMAILSILHHAIERFFSFNLTVWWSKRQIKKHKLKRIWDILKWNEDADVFIMGHLHKPECVIWINDDGKIKTYCNTGDWVDSRSYVTITDGVLRLKKYEKNSEDFCRDQDLVFKSE